MWRTEFERVTPEQAGISSAAIGRLVDKLESGFTEMHGLMIMRHGKICAEGWWSPYAPGLRHGLQSLTKTYTGTAVGIAYTEGLLRLEDRIADIFSGELPKHPSENLRKMTIRDVLCMGCGMEDMCGPSKNWVREFLAAPVVHSPGTAFRYNSLASSLLGAAIQKLTGLGLHDYLRPRLFDQIGIDGRNLRWMLLPDGMEMGSGGLFATTEDNLRLMKLYADGGLWDGKRILAADYVEKAVSLQNASDTEKAGNPDAADNFVGYGFQIWLCRPQGVYRADGGMGQFAIAVPNKDMILSITETAPGAREAQQTLDAVWEFLEEVDGEAVQPETAETDRLRRRMSTLALPAPRVSRRDEKEREVSGKWFVALEEGLSLAIDNRVNRQETPPGIECFSFDFTAEDCVMQYEQGGCLQEARIALDGTRRENGMAGAGDPASRLLLNGYWKTEDTFAVVARWIETCFEKELSFRFEGGGVLIRQELTVGASGPFLPESAGEIPAKPMI